MKIKPSTAAILCIIIIGLLMFSLSGTGSGGIVIDYDGVKLL